MKKIVILLLAFISWCVVAQTNELELSMPFSLKATLEPDGVTKSFMINDSEWISLSKTNGAVGTASVFQLEKYDLNLKKKWSKKILLEKSERVIQLFTNNETVQVFISVANLESNQSSLHVREYSIANGSLLTKNELVQVKVRDWVEGQNKGSVKESFTNAVLSKQESSFVEPLNYQFYIEQSSDKSKTLIYRYDYAQRTLVAQLWTFDSALSPLEKGLVPIDKGFVSYGFKINNAGSSYLYKVNTSGKVAVIQYDLKTKESKYLTLEANSSTRDNLTLFIEEDEIIYLAKLNKENEQLTGVTITKMDFKEEKIVDSYYHGIGENFKNKVENELAKAGVRRKEDWQHFMITDFIIDPVNGFTFVLEERYLEVGGHAYDGSEMNDIKKWRPATIGQIHCGTVIIMRFDHDGKFLWENVLAKDQKANLNEGINSISYVFSEFDNAYHFLWTTSRSGILNTKLYYQQVNANTGKTEVINEIKNPEKVVMSRIYSFFTPQNSIVIVGRKGIIGKKSILSKYKLN